MLYYLPTNLDLFKSLPFPKKSIEKDFFKYNYIISNLFIQRYSRKYYVESHIELNFAKLKKIIGEEDTKRIIQNLIHFKIIECDNLCVKGEKNYGYKLNNIYTEQHYILENCEDKVSVRCDKYYKQEYNETELNLFRDLQKLKHNIVLDYNFQGLSDQEKRYKQANNFHLESFGNRNIRFKKDKYGRIHTPLTNLERGLKANLSLNGKNIFEIDYACSQPRFIALEASKEFGMTSDIQNFLKLCEGEKSIKLDLYNYLMFKIGYNKSRDEFKKFILQNLYGKRFTSKKLEEIFLLEFPNIYKFILKQKENGHANFARNMQKVESDLVIQTVCKNLYEKYEGISLCTIHDSVICNEEYVKCVKFEMELAFEEIYNYKLFCDSSQLSFNFLYNNK